MRFREEEAAVNQGTSARFGEGVIYALAAYGWWGLVPLYFHALKHVPPLELLAHRIVWSIFFLAFLLWLLRGFDELRRVLGSPRDRRWLLLTTLLIAVNWFVYIYAVVRGQIVDASLGYFMNPLVSVLLGLVVLGERLRRLQWLAVLLAVVAVLRLTLAAGKFPWISLTLAGCFGLYGLLRKQINADGLVGLSVEVLFLFPLALMYVGWLWATSQLAFGRHGWLDLVLTFSGVVTAVPLMCFGQAARRLPLVMLGFLQYLSPTIQLLLALLVFGEPFEPEKVLCFVLIWAGLLVFTIDSMPAVSQKRWQVSAIPATIGNKSSYPRVSDPMGDTPATESSP